MISVRKQVMAIYVDRASEQWIIRDPDGGLWALPQSEHPWDDRQPYSLTEQSELEPVPGHYRHMLRIPGV